MYIIIKYCTSYSAIKYRYTLLKNVQSYIGWIQVIQSDLYISYVSLFHFHLAVEAVT